MCWCHFSFFLDSENNNNNNNNNLITGSAAIKISSTAKACDVTNLLRQTLHLNNSGSSNSKSNSSSTTTNTNSASSTTTKDSLVLVGTLRSIPNDYVRFEHEQQVNHQMQQHNTNQFQFQQQQQDKDNDNDNDDDEEKIKKKVSTTNNNNGISISDYCTGQDFHIIKTLDEDDTCLSILDRMQKHLHQRQQDIDSNNRSNHNNHNSSIAIAIDIRRPTIAPQTRWYYVPNIIPQQQQQPPIMSSCLELDGYVTSLENENEEEDDDDDDDNDGIDIDDTDEDENIYTGFGAASSVVPVGDEDLLHRALAPFDNDIDIEDDDDAEGCDTDTENNSKNKNNNKTKIAREWRNYLQISQSHVSSGADSSPSPSTTTASTTNSTTLAGYLLKKSNFDPYVWKLHYCILTEDDFWYVPRIKNKKKNKNVRNTNEIIMSGIEMASYHGRIPLIDTLLLDNSKTGRRNDEFEIVDGNGITHTYRCPAAAAAAAVTAPATTTTRAAVAVVAKDWRNMLSIRSQNAFENSLIKHAELILTEENLSRTERWKNIVVDDECDDNSNNDGNDDGTKTKEGRTINASLTVVSSSPSSRSILMYNCGGSASSSGNSNHSLRLQSQSKILRFGMDIAEYKENCRHIQTLLWVDYSSAAAATVVVAPSSNFNSNGSTTTTTTTNTADNDVSSTSSSSSTTTTTTTLRLVRETWKEASGLLQQAIIIISSINKHRERDISRSLDTMCRHIEYIITRQRRRRQAPSQFSDDNKNDDEIIRNSSTLDDDTNGNENEASSVNYGTGPGQAQFGTNFISRCCTQLHRKS
ncbi:hypothetical protein FRACYDRAFT_244810 [Fragilariopsis cylindrus CCMP1102]|uniref:PH domain-containing protein n=1 Tax=Fragilariopsis cylindrus CCMP1102 TaxID=635003 RepID=A0A1E7F0M5_9STRA|nr:hypothetical protein FRACYDRAFT_244810 [Fragilariopsis cylindrus CCMP1102]|eukprot:OEU11687.1 hypothetical protein FRACYDRAFT_244810 [Fragilariopsis cylindrus CCMP1102]